MADGSFCNVVKALKKEGDICFSRLDKRVQPVDMKVSKQKIDPSYWSIRVCVYW